MSLKTHLKIDVQKRNGYDGDVPQYRTVTELLCGKDYADAEKAGLVEPGSDYVTCKRCLELAGSALNDYGRALKPLYEALQYAEDAARVDASEEVARVRRYFKEQVAEAVRLYGSALRDAERALERVETIGNRALTYQGGADVAHEVNRGVAFLAGNIRTDLLFRYGAELDSAIRRAVKGEEDPR